MSILNDIDSLIVTLEDEYYDGSSFWNRNKGKILGAGAALGGIALGHGGQFGPGAQHFINSNARMIGQGLSKAGEVAKKFGMTYNIPGRTVPFTGISV